MEPLILAALGGALTTAFNAAGALPVLLLKRPSRKVLDLGLGFAAGVMMAASFTSLLLPGIEMGGLLPPLLGFLLGAASITVADRLVPHMHEFKGVEGVYAERLKAAVLFALAVTIHNMPEGLAVGVSFTSGRFSDALALAIAIGLQNVPEGLSVGFSMLSASNMSRGRAYLVSALSGAVELPLAVLGALAASTSASVLPIALGFAAGAMIFVVSDEVIPETHRIGHERAASYGVVLGVLVMTILDKALS